MKNAYMKHVSPCVRRSAFLVLLSATAGCSSCDSSSDTGTQDAAPETDVAVAPEPDASVPDAGSGEETAPAAIPDATVAEAGQPAADGAGADAPAADGSGADAAGLGGVTEGGAVVVIQPSGGGTGPNKGHIFGATSYNPPNAPVFDVTGADGGAPSLFATVPADGWLGPMLLTNDGKFYVASNAQNGSIWEISAGGDFTSKQPIVANIFPTNLTYIEGMARDASGNFYLANSEAGLTQIAKVTPGADGGAITYLPTSFDNPANLVVAGNVLLVAEGNKGRVVAHDIVSGNEAVWATGFVPGSSHISASLVVDRRGHLLVNWSTSGAGTGIYDITAGGDFTNATPIVAATYSIDVNQIAVDDANDIFVAGADSDNMYVSRFAAGAWGAFVVFATGLGDNESVGVAP
jgi:hypothetical protein